MLLQLVWRPVAVRGGVPQGAEELERDEDAVDHESDCSRGGEEVQVPLVIGIPADHVGQRVQGVGTVGLLRAVEHLGAALHQRPDGDGIEGNAGVDAVECAVLGRGSVEALGALRHGEERAERQEARVLHTFICSAFGLDVSRRVRTVAMNLRNRTSSGSPSIAHSGEPTCPRSSETIDVTHSANCTSTGGKPNGISNVIEIWKMLGKAMLLMMAVFEMRAADLANWAAAFA